MPQHSIGIRGMVVHALSDSARAFYLALGFKESPGLKPRTYGRELYKQRNRIERCFYALKHFPRFSTRYCRTIEAFRSTTASHAPESDSSYIRDAA